jgi:hypothetical protein
MKITLTVTLDTSINSDHEILNSLINHERELNYPALDDHKPCQLDSSGSPHEPAIHSATFKKNNDGTWRKRKAAPKEDTVATIAIPDNPLTGVEYNFPTPEITYTIPLEPEPVAIVPKFATTEYGQPIPEIIVPPPPPKPVVISPDALVPPPPPGSYESKGSKSEFTKMMLHVAPLIDKEITHADIERFCQQIGCVENGKPQIALMQTRVDLIPAFLKLVNTHANLS